MFNQCNVLKMGMVVSALAVAVSASAAQLYTNVGFNVGGVQVSIPVAVPVPVVVSRAPQVYYSQPVPVQQQVVTTYQNGYQTQTVTQTTTTYAQPVQAVYGQAVYVQPASAVVVNGACSFNQHNCGYNSIYHNRQNYDRRNDRRDNDRYDRYGYQSVRPNVQRTSIYIPKAVPTSRPQVSPTYQQPNPSSQPNLRAVGYNVNM